MEFEWFLYPFFFFSFLQFYRGGGTFKMLKLMDKSPRHALGAFKPSMSFFMCVCFFFARSLSYYLNHYEMKSCRTERILVLLFCCSLEATGFAGVKAGRFVQIPDRVTGVPALPTTHPSTASLKVNDLKNTYMLFVDPFWFLRSFSFCCCCWCTPFWSIHLIIISAGEDFFVRDSKKKGNTKTDLSDVAGNGCARESEKPTTGGFVFCSCLHTQPLTLRTGSPSVSLLLPALQLGVRTGKDVGTTGTTI